MGGGWEIVAWIIFLLSESQLSCRLILKPPSPALCMGHNYTFQKYSPYVDEDQQLQG